MIASQEATYSKFKEIFDIGTTTYLAVIKMQKIHKKRAEKI